MWDLETIKKMNQAEVEKQEKQVEKVSQYQGILESALVTSLQERVEKLEKENSLLREQNSSIKEEFNDLYTDFKRLETWAESQDGYSVL